MKKLTIIKRGILTSLALVLLAVPLAADVRYTMQVRIREPEAAPAPPAHPLLAVLRKSLVDAIAPGGSSQFVLSASAEGLRVEYRDQTASIPKGGVVLIKPDGSTLILDPSTQTYWKVTRSTPQSKALLSFDVPPARTGEFAKVSGVRAERIKFAGRFDLSKSSTTSVPPELADALKLEGEVWVTNAVAAPPIVAELTSPALRMLGLDTAVGKALVVRQVLRGPILGGKEIESLVSGINTRKIAPAQMRVPDGYREVPAPEKR